MSKIDKLIVKQKLPTVHPLAAHSRTVKVGKPLVCIKCGAVASCVLEYRQKGEPEGTRHVDIFAESPTRGLVMLTVDHILPVSWGGNNSVTNKQIMCHICNNKKANVLKKAELVSIVRNLSDHFGGNNNTGRLIPHIFSQHRELVNYQFFDLIYAQLELMLVSNRHKFGQKEFKIIEKQMVQYIALANKHGIITSYYQEQNNQFC